MKIAKYFVFPQMKMAALLFLCLLPPLFGDVDPAYPPNPTDSQGGMTSPGFSEANAHAIYWINLIDQKQYSATWLEASGLLRDIVTQGQWANAMAGTRETLGNVTSRKVVSHRTSQFLPYGTRGNFMTIYYDTQYANMPNAKESITLMTEGRLALWRVVSYRIEPRR